MVICYVPSAAHPAESLIAVRMIQSGLIFMLGILVSWVFQTFAKEKRDVALARNELYRCLGQIHHHLLRISVTHRDLLGKGDDDYGEEDRWFVSRLIQGATNTDFYDYLFESDRFLFYRMDDRLVLKHIFGNVKETLGKTESLPTLREKAGTVLGILSDMEAEARRGSLDYKKMLHYSTQSDRHLAKIERKRDHLVGKETGIYPAWQATAHGLFDAPDSPPNDKKV